jgi:ferredoxin-NADP reductase
MMKWLDRITGTVTMYRLVLISLLLLLVETLLLSFLGVITNDPIISEQPFGILVSGLVLLVFTFVSNWIFAKLFRVKPHTESTFITALLLLFIFEPISQFGATLVPQLVGLAAAGVIASASKYLLAWHGRHIFNPAAVGAFVVTVIPYFASNGDFAAWWLATPWLLPVTIVLGFVILYRTRRQLMGLTFVVVVFFLTFWVYGGNGAPLAQTLLEPFTTFSTLFFAAFMLSEPLTMPPRRWQQLTEAVIVAIIFTVPFTIGSVFSTTTPQFALLVGNLLAFLVGQRGGIRLDFVKRVKLTPSSWELSFRPQRPVRFRAGQYMELSIPHPGADVRGLRRIFSIASAPSETAEIRIGLNTAERSSSFKKALLSLEPGEVITATSVGGDFLLPKDPARRLLFVAGGIGVTPFMSHLQQIESAGEGRDVAVLYSASSPDEFAYTEQLQKLGHPVYLVSPEPPTPLPKGWTYVGTGPLTPSLLAKTIPDVESRDAFVSGPPAFVHAVRALLRGAHAHSVKTDFFSGYTARSARPVAAAKPTATAKRA